MKVVLDANIFVSFFLTKNPRISKIFHLWQEKIITIIVSPAIKAEIFAVFQYPKIKKLLTLKDFQALKYLLDNQTVLVYPRKRVFLCADPEDNIYLECCQESQADFLISGDNHLLKLEKFKQTRIVSPTIFCSHRV